MKNEHARFRQMKKDLDLTNKDIAEITGIDTNSVKNATQPKHNLPRNLKLAIHVHEYYKRKYVEPVNNFIQTISK